LVEEIQGAIEVAQTQQGDVLENAICEHTKRVTARLRTSAILSDAIAKRSLMIVGSRYDLVTGLVEIIA
jgi:hypothetical protein